MGGNRSLETYKLKKTPHNFVKLRETSARVGLERVRNGPSVGGSFAVASAPMVLERWSSERWGAREAFFWRGKGASATMRALGEGQHFGERSKTH